MASTARLLPSTNIYYLTHFFGDWAKEMLNPITEANHPAQSLYSKLGVRASISQSFVHAFADGFLKKFRPVRAVVWNGPSVFNAR